MTAVAALPIEKTPGVCGGNARVAGTRIPVWLLVAYRRQGATDAALLGDFPALAAEQVTAAWDYYRENPLEIDRAVWWNDTAATPDGERARPEVLVAGLLLGLSGAEIVAGFEVPVTDAELDAAWQLYRQDPARFRPATRG